MQFQSDVPFEYGEKERVELSAHLPGLVELSDARPTLKIAHTYTDASAELTQNPGVVAISSPWKDELPPDFIHLAYGAARLEWLKQGIIPVHAACVGNEEEGYTLIMGNPGSGKTSVTLHNLQQYQQKVFSGDKTLVRFDGNQLVAIAGTDTITIRSEDIPRWKELPKMDEFSFVDRLAFQLPTEFYAHDKEVVIKRIVLVALNDTRESITQLSPTSALHTLYPLFLDKQREDILVDSDAAFLDGAISKEERIGFVKSLKTAMETIPVYKAVGSLEKVGAFIANKSSEKKILFGIAGISNGHCSRQTPIIKHLLEQGHKIMVFTYGDGPAYFADHFQEHPHLTIVPVADPYFVGTVDGLDYEQTAHSEKNQVDFNKINALAMHRAMNELGKPDLVISDYEMVAAQLAYAKRVPLVTIDQQSKYLVGDFVPVLNNTSCQDEVERLSMFFPKADKRIAVSFFRVDNRHAQDDFIVEVYPPMIRPDVINGKGTALSPTPSILVYITAQQLGEQPVDEWIATIKNAVPQNYVVHVFLPLRLELPLDEERISYYHHGDKRFDSILFASHGIISTAGHNLLTEAMFLEKPVYAFPLPIYEQQINAYMIAQGGFGVSSKAFTQESIRDFLSHLDGYAKNIREDTKYLFKEPANDAVINKVVQMLK